MAGQRITWLKGCEVCNVGLIKKMDDLIDRRGISIRKAARLVADEGERKVGMKLYSEDAIRNRYLLHKGKRNPHPEKEKVDHSDPPSKPKKPTNKGPTTTIKTKVEETETVVPPEPENLDELEDVETPGFKEVSIDFTIESNKASAAANKPKKSELEKAADHIVKSAGLLEQICEGQIKDGGTNYDQLAAQTIIRHGPGIIHSFFRLGIDPAKAVNFYKGNGDSCTSRTGKIR